MPLTGIALGRRTGETLEEAYARALSAELTYRHVGSTLQPGSVPGVRDMTVVREVPGTLAAAQATLRCFAPHDGIRARILPPDAALEVRQTLVVVLPFGPIEMCVPTRIVVVVDEPTRFGFAYGTLPGHVEAGEELFLAEAVDADRLRLTIRIHARAASALARLGGPVSPLLQRLAAHRYLAAWSAAIAEEEGR
jgi:uncharacterized protein (UPF0548 family)